MSRPEHLVVCAMLAGALVAACGGAPVADDHFVVHAPSSNQFANKGVGVFLDARCGTLDCHGSTFRNLRLYGKEGLRLDASTLPGAGDTTPAELDVDYRSVVGLEPEVITAVVRDQGARPERLTMIRKARGTEDHKGGQLWSAGDDQDRCVTTWLAGQADADACARALASTR